MRTGASCLAGFVSRSPVSLCRFSLARGSFTSLSASSSWSISWSLEHSQHFICAWTQEQTLHCGGFQPLWVLLLHLRHEPWGYDISDQTSAVSVIEARGLRLRLTLYSSRASFQESTSAESSQISSCEAFVFDGAMSSILLFGEFWTRAAEFRQVSESRYWLTSRATDRVLHPYS